MYIHSKSNHQLFTSVVLIDTIHAHPSIGWFRPPEPCTITDWSTAVEWVVEGGGPMESYSSIRIRTLFHRTTEVVVFVSVDLFVGRQALGDVDQLR